MKRRSGQSRRAFIGKATVAAAGMASSSQSEEAKRLSANPTVGVHEPDSGSGGVRYPRVFDGRHLSMIGFPLGGIGAGSISLGGRGQLRDWEIFNRADKGNNPSYALPCIWVQAGDEEPVARVLEGRYQPPFEGQDGLGSRNAPGLTRLAAARFTGEYPLAQIEFEDSSLPVHVSLEAFSPFIPHEPDDSGLPVAVLRYKVRNPGTRTVRVSIAWSIENPVKPSDRNDEKRMNQYRTGKELSGLMMSNPNLQEADLFHGSFVLAAMNEGEGKFTYLRGWQRGKWWNSPLLFWDDFSKNGELGPEAAETDAVGALCLSRSIGEKKMASYTFLLAWHFPNRTPARCGWKAPSGFENTVIGNWYSTKFSDAWKAAEYAAENLPRLERMTRLFAASLRESTLPPGVLDAASANLSTLATTTCFRTADGEFHGFEGADDKLGCCFGNCTHVWNYETATAHLFPSFAASLRRAAFGYSMDDAGAMHFRQLLPDGKERMGFAAADGQMGQIVHTYLDWKLSGDRRWLEDLWPRVRKAIEFAWVPGGWDANRDGVLEGVQHNTYDIEFYGPNPQCGIYYLAALRACEEMARTLGDNAFGDRCRQLFRSGSEWIDSHLFNGEYFEQQVRPFRDAQIAPSLRSSMGAEDPEHPEFQLGKGCLVDQMVGQALAEVCGLGPLLNTAHIRKALQAVYRYNYKRTLYKHASVQRTFALNDESALVICDYGSVPRPRIPFPYFAEVMTGFEYSTAAHMLFQGMIRQGIECMTNVRARYDGERRNPWDEAECGHHYARAMAAWSGVLALSGFDYHAGEQRLSVFPKIGQGNFKCFWSTGTGWGSFAQSSQLIEVLVQHGRLVVQTCALPMRGGKGTVTYKGKAIAQNIEQGLTSTVFRLSEPLAIDEGQSAIFEVHS